MPKEIAMFSLWGAWVIHCQILVIALLTRIMPQGFWWEIVFFLLSLVVFGLNIGANYVWAALSWFKTEDQLDNILGIVLLALLNFVAIPTGSTLAAYVYFATEKVQHIENCPDATQQKGIFELKNAQLRHELTTEATFKHTHKAKGQSATTYPVNYKLTPLLCDTNATNEYRYFVVYNDAEKLIYNFNLRYVAVFAGYSKYKNSYPALLTHWAKKHQKSYAKNPLFLELIDLEATTISRKSSFLWFYGIVMGIWVSLTLIFPFGIYLKNKFF